MPTVTGNPWLFRGNLGPISDFIKDAGKKKEMDVAVRVHLDKAYLTVKTTKKTSHLSFKENKQNSDFKHFLFKWKRAPSHI